jgi:hypothetical protein
VGADDRVGGIEQLRASLGRSAAVTGNGRAGHQRHSRESGPALADFMRSSEVTI